MLLKKEVENPKVKPIPEEELTDSCTEDTATNSEDESTSQNIDYRDFDKMMKFYDNDYDASDLDEESDWETESECDSELCQQEVLEALKSDPDLLMRIIELEMAGEDPSYAKEIIERLKNLTVNLPCENQKGLADIDPTKIEQARQGAKYYQEYSEDDSEDETVEDETGSDQPPLVKQKLEL
jgi:hypothetical protein